MTLNSKLENADSHKTGITTLLIQVLLSVFCVGICTSGLRGTVVNGISLSEFRIYQASLQNLGPLQSHSDAVGKDED